MLFPHLNVFDNIAYGLKIKKIKKKIVKTEVNELCKKLNISLLLKRDVKTLSGGEKKRVAIARAIANNPSLLLADEPTGNLDPSLAQEILELLKALTIEREIAVIMVTHSPEAADFGTVRIHLNEGRIV